MEKYNWVGTEIQFRTTPVFVLFTIQKIRKKIGYVINMIPNNLDIENKVEQIMKSLHLQILQRIKKEI